MELFTVKEVAKKLKLNEDSIRNMMAAGTIKSIKLKGIRAVRITQSEINRLLGVDDE